MADIKLDIKAKDPQTPTKLHDWEQGYIWADDCEENFRAFLSSEEAKLESINQATKENFDANELARSIKKHNTRSIKNV